MVRTEGARSGIDGRCGVGAVAWQEAYLLRWDRLPGPDECRNGE